MLAFLESLYLISVDREGAEGPGALIAEVNADEDDYSHEMERRAYRSALMLLVADADPALEPPVDPAWSRVEGLADIDSGSHALPS